MLVRCSLVPVAAARAGTRWVPLLLPACCSLSPAAVAGSLRAARCLLAAAHCRCSPRCYLPLPLAAAKNHPCHERGSGTEVWHDTRMRFLGVHTSRVSRASSLVRVAVVRPRSSMSTISLSYVCVQHVVDRCVCRVERYVYVHQSKHMCVCISRRQTGACVE